MFSVQRVTATPSSVKQMQYAYLEHLHLYPNNQPPTPKLEVEDVDEQSPSFLDQLERAHLRTPSMKEREFLDRRTKFQEQEELLQQMNYTNGLHYSQLYNIEELHQ